MRKLRNGLVLIMTGAIIALGALLPKIYAQIQDSVSDEKVEYAEIKTIFFEHEITIIEKLFLLRDGLQVSAQEEATDRTEEEVLELIYSEIEYYRSIMVIWENLNNCEVQIEPVRFFYGDSKHTTSIFWQVEFYQEEWGTIRLWVDDETGVILLISYETIYETYGIVDLEPVLNLFYNCYLDRLQLWEEMETSFVKEGAEDLSSDNSQAFYDDLEEYNEKKKTYSIATVFTIDDAIYGELELYFYISANGFYVSLE